jgi:hypothetical protein
MNEEKILELLNDYGPLHPDSDFEQVRDFVDRSPLEPNEKQSLRDYLTQPKLRLIRAQSPEAGHDCVQMIEVRLPPALKGLHPRLHVCVPHTLEHLPGLEVPEKADRLLGTTTDAERKLWRLLNPVLNREIEPVWRAELAFRLPKEPVGTYLWKFRIDFEDCWGHAELHRLFEARCTDKISREKDGATVLIEAGDCSNVHIRNDSSRKVIIRANDNLNVFEAPQLPGDGYDSNSPQRSSLSTPLSESIDLHVTEVHPAPTTGYITRVVTPCRYLKNAHSIIRDSWPGCDVVCLQITAGDRTRSHALKLHAPQHGRPLRLGRDDCDSEKLTKSGKVKFGRRQDIVTRYEKDKDATCFSSDVLDDLNFVISGSNTELEVTERHLVIRNAGTLYRRQDGNIEHSAGYTRVSWKGGDIAKHELHDKVELDIKENNGPVHLKCGGGYRNGHTEIGELPGYPLNLIPVPTWNDASKSGCWPGPEDYVPQTGEQPSTVGWASTNGMDSLLIRHGLHTRSGDPLHVLLLRQLWLDESGRPLECSSDNPRARAVVRLLVANCMAGEGHVFLLQPLRSKWKLTVRYTNQPEMQVAPFDITPLCPGIQITLKTESGTPLWTANFPDEN